MGPNWLQPTPFCDWLNMNIFRNDFTKDLKRLDLTIKPVSQKAQKLKSSRAAPCWTCGRWLCITEVSGWRIRAVVCVCWQ